MIKDVIESSASQFGIRFALVSVLPMAVLLSLVTLLVAGGAPGQTPDFKSAIARVEDQELATSILLAAVIVISGLALHPLQLSVTRLLEGYWGDSRVANAIGTWAKQRHLKRHRKLLADSRLRTPRAGGKPPREEVTRASLATRAFDRSYPPDEERVMPTKLGNVIRAAEDRAGAPYGLDAISIWPYLYAVLPEQVRELVDDRRNQLDTAIGLCASFALATLVTLVLLLKAQWWLALPVSLGLLAWLSYRGAMAAGRAYGVAIQTAIVLHRFDLLRALHLPLPQDLHFERKINEELCDFLRQNVGNNFKYDHES